MRIGKLPKSLSTWKANWRMPAPNKNGEAKARKNTSGEMNVSPKFYKFLATAERSQQPKLRSFWKSRRLVICATLSANYTGMGIFAGSLTIPLLLIRYSTGKSRKQFLFRSRLLRGLMRVRTSHAANRILINARSA